MSTRSFSCSPPNRGGLECTTPLHVSGPAPSARVPGSLRGEMVLIYDDVSDSRGRASLIFDAIFSAFRQHVLRGGAGIAVSSLRHNPDGGPLFAGIENSRPSLLILANGCAATALAWLGLSFMMSPARDHRMARLEFGGAHRLVDSRLYPPPVQIRASGPSAKQAARAEDRQPQARSVPSGKAARSIWSRMLSAFGVTSGAATRRDCVEGEKRWHVCFCAAECFPRPPTTSCPFVTQHWRFVYFGPASQFDRS